jgi:hypothetical protein
MFVKGIHFAEERGQMIWAFRMRREVSELLGRCVVNYGHTGGRKLTEKRPVGCKLRSVVISEGPRKELITELGRRSGKNVLRRIPHSSRVAKKFTARYPLVITVITWSEVMEGSIVMLIERSFRNRGRAALM